ncbi:MAG: hypothetical protein ACOYMN_17900, partial [Roseimicrobium sp.]
VRNDGLIQSRSGVVPVATQPLRITASPQLQCAIPSLAGHASEEKIVSLTGVHLEADDVVTFGSVRTEGAALPSGIVADASVVDGSHVAVRFTNVSPQPVRGGQMVTFRVLVHSEATK